MSERVFRKWEDAKIQAFTWACIYKYRLGPWSQLSKDVAKIIFNMVLDIRAFENGNTLSLRYSTHRLDGDFWTQIDLDNDRYHYEYLWNGQQAPPPRPYTSMACRKCKSLLSDLLTKGAEEIFGIENEDGSITCGMCRYVNKDHNNIIMSEFKIRKANSWTCK